MKLTSIVRLGVLACSLMLCSAVASADISQVAREVVASHGDAVITVEVVTQQKYSYGGSMQEAEDKSEVFGVVIDESGLVVTALSSVDQAQLYRRMRADQQDNSFSSTVKEITYILPDNSEIPATIILRDPDLDLAFLRPKTKPEKKFTFISLEDSAKPQLVEPAFSIGRMGRIARRTVLGMTGEIQGIVERPRAYYIPSSELASTGTGVPVFNGEGKLLGLVLTHLFPGGSAAATDTDEMIIIVVVPAEDIAETAAQAPKEAIEAPAEPAEEEVVVKPGEDADEDSTKADEQPEN